MRFHGYVGISTISTRFPGIKQVTIINAVSLWIFVLHRASKWNHEGFELCFLNAVVYEKWLATSSRTLQAKLESKTAPSETHWEGDAVCRSPT